jgi:hypothetical protein
VPIQIKIKHLLVNNATDIKKKRRIELLLPVTEVNPLPERGPETEKKENGNGYQVICKEDKICSQF